MCTDGHHHSHADGGESRPLRVPTGPMSRRTFAQAGGGLLLLPACSTIPGFGMVDAVQRILFLSSERAFARMLQADGFWDQQVAQVGFSNLLGARGDVLTRILTSALFKDRLEQASQDYAENPLAMEIITFIREGDRPICKPG